MTSATAAARVTPRGPGRANPPFARELALMRELAEYRACSGLFGFHHRQTAELTAPELVELGVDLVAVDDRLTVDLPDPLPPEKLALSLTTAPAAPPSARPAVD